MIDAILAKARTMAGSRSFRYAFSSAGDPCLRALVYDAQDHDDGKPPASGTRRLRDVLAMACGNGVGYALESAAKELGAYTQEQHRFSTGGIRVRGNSDIAVPEIVIDIKLVGEKSWARRPHKRHILQVNGYAVEYDAPTWGLLYVRGSTLFDDTSAEAETDFISRPSSIELAQELCGIWEEVEQHRKLRTLPERVFLAKPGGWPCGWCRHLERCAPEAENA